MESIGGRTKSSLEATALKLSRNTIPGNRNGCTLLFSTVQSTHSLSLALQTKLCFPGCYGEALECILQSRYETWPIAKTHLLRGTEAKKFATTTTAVTNNPTAGGHRLSNRKTKSLRMTKSEEKTGTIEPFSNLGMGKILKRLTLPAATVLKT